MKRLTPGPGRVVASHQIARGALLAAGAFSAVAAGWSVYVLVAGGSWWGPLHTFMAGTVLLAISGASQMFTITWSSTVPPGRGVVLAQRWLLIVGVSAVLAGVPLRVPALVVAGAGAIVASIVILAWVVLAAVRKSLLRRFDLSARFYLTAFACGVGGVAVGAILAAASLRWTLPGLRLAHAHLNLVGLVGLTIVGTIPTLLPTTAYSPAVSGREALVAWWLSLAGAAAMAAGLLAPRLVGIGTLAIALAGGLILGGISFRLWSRGRRKPAFLQISAGTIWLVGWGAADGVSVTVDGTMASFSGWTGAVVLGGVGQVLAGSLAYLIPVLKGSPFVANRRIMESRPWLPIVAVNAAALCLGFGLPVAAAFLAGIWLLDFGLRLARVATSGQEKDDIE